jgi:hypothetical protein
MAAWSVDQSAPAQHASGALCVPSTLLLCRLAHHVAGAVQKTTRCALGCERPRRVEVGVRMCDACEHAATQKLARAALASGRELRCAYARVRLPWMDAATRTAPSPCGWSWKREARASHLNNITDFGAHSTTDHPPLRCQIAQDNVSNLIILGQQQPTKFDDAWLHVRELQRPRARRALPAATTPSQAVPATPP